MANGYFRAEHRYTYHTAADCQVKTARQRPICHVFKPQCREYQTYPQARQGNDAKCHKTEKDKWYNHKCENQRVLIKVRTSLETSP